MACNCIDILPKMLIDELNQRAHKPEGFQVLHSEWERLSIYPKKAIYANLLIKSNFTKKNGKGSIPRNELFTFYFSFCPFVEHNMRVKILNH